MTIDRIVQLIQSAVQFGTIIMFGAMGENSDAEVRQPESGRSGPYVSGRHRRPCGLLLL